MGAMKSKLAGCCPPRCVCCLDSKSDSWDLKKLPRPPLLDTSNDAALNNSRSNTMVVLSAP
ncbi:hypothetical protein RR48_14178 [Papilio machaon]|uniref:Uncharacterized protein n=1 Tax=Papilio machaon TaxID=76193 RepID=A0A194QM49_PAPMA|nr:hypothetical protein RR48_14178 [Papilio machaon]